MTEQAQVVGEPVSPRDMVGSVLHLASSWVDAVTGQLCPLDRGLVEH